LSAAMPTAEAVWARVRSATITGSALYAGLAVSVSGGATTALRAGVNWSALVFAGVSAAALAVQARVSGSALQRVSLGVPAAALLMVGCVCTQGGTSQMAWAGFATLLAVAVVAAVTGLKALRGNRSHPWGTVWAYLQYTVFAALIPAALWATGVYGQLEMG